MLAINGVGAEIVLGAAMEKRRKEKRDKK